MTDQSDAMKQQAERVSDNTDETRQSDPGAAKTEPIETHERDEIEAITKVVGEGQSADQPYWTGSFRGPLAPEGFTLRADEDAMTYTEVGSGGTGEESTVWFNTTDAAEKAGFKQA